MQCVILAAGKGTRLHPITLSRSKAMIPLCGKPMVERVVDAIAKNGVDDFIFIVAPDDDAIIDHFQAKAKGKFQFVCQHERKGMAHALQLASPLIHDDFLLCACDNIVGAADITKMVDLWNEGSKLSALLSLLEMSPEKICKSSAVCLDQRGWVSKIVEKPSIDNLPSNVASIALYIFSQKILEYLPQVKPSPRGEYELQDAIQMMIEDHGAVKGIQITGRKTVSSASDLLRINIEYLQNQKESSAELLSSANGATIIQPVRIDPNVSVGENCIIGPNVYLERNCVVGNGVTIKSSVVLSSAEISPKANIEDQVVA